MLLLLNITDIVILFVSSNFLLMNALSLHYWGTAIAYIEVMFEKGYFSGVKSFINGGGGKSSDRSNHIQC